ncbi:cytochrome [Parafrankia colletiae]|uniref:Cytochrome n=1 Tax=Parafrankia colletiae TaxID=573497 RepID=A0A1S1RAK5_9ACTN|nr:cytochrome P450 [Parafrankia colletiae]MCK9905050.1 cytochrome P450 [Frankia sp. Cpl3]OHV43873.1 cytochrome [Parafrankia colletiae]
METAATPEQKAGQPPAILTALDAVSRPDPYPTYRSIQEGGAFIRCDVGGWVTTMVTGYADCSAAFQSPSFGNGYSAGIHADAHRTPGSTDSGLKSLLRKDPPEHTRLRGLVSRAFTPGVVATLTEEITSLVDTLLDAALAAGEVDLIEAFARPLPLFVICRLLGVPTQDEPVFSEWIVPMVRGLAPDMTLTPEDLRARTEATNAIHDYFRELIAEVRARPRHDLLSQLVAAAQDSDDLPEQEILDLCVLLLVAGFETTVNLIGSGTVALLRNPDQMARLRADPDLVPAAVEEMLRYDPTFPFTVRTALRDTEVNGRSFRRGDGVVLLLAAANRDPDAYREPDRFDVARYADSADVPRHLGLGLGVHYCLGAPLARAEGVIAFRALLARAERITLLDEPSYRTSSWVRAMSHLPLRLSV